MTPRKIDELLPRFAENCVSRSFDFGDGWTDLVLKLHEDLIEIDPEYKIIQAKQKFAGLRYYTTHNTEACGAPETPHGNHDWLKCPFERRIQKAENDSFDICEKCGDPGQIVYKYGVRTLCDVHAESWSPYKEQIEAMKASKADSSDSSESS